MIFTCCPLNNLIAFIQDCILLASNQFGPGERSRMKRTKLSFPHSAKGLSVPWLCFAATMILSDCGYLCNGAVPIDPRLSAPWVASIFHKNPTNNLWEYICGGTLTSPNTVITSARCVLPRISKNDKLSTRPYHYAYSDLQVVVGLKTNSLEAKDQFTQFGAVGQIRDLFTFTENPDTPYQDLAALRLRNRFNLSTPYVKDVLLTEFGQTILEANATKAGDTVIVAGFERVDNSQVVGVQTRSKTTQPLQIHEILLTDVGSCIDRYTTSYDAFYFDVLCGKGKSSKDLIPCRYEGAGMITKGVRDHNVKNAKSEFYLMGVYSSNTALAKNEGAIKTKNQIKPGDCASNDVIFFTKLGYLERWGISHDFCGYDLAACLDNKCRPYEDLCDGVAQCDDKSDEAVHMCQNNQKVKKI